MTQNTIITDCKKCGLHYYLNKSLMRVKKKKNSISQKRWAIQIILNTAKLPVKLNQPNLSRREIMN